MWMVRRPHQTGPSRDNRPSFARSVPPWRTGSRVATGFPQQSALPTVRGGRGRGQTPAVAGEDGRAGVTGNGLEGPGVPQAPRPSRMPGRHYKRSRMTTATRRRFFALALARTLGTRLRTIAVPGLVAAAPVEHS
jgi:hypothetical protein